MQCDNEPTVQRSKEINYTRDKEIKLNICQSKEKNSRTNSGSSLGYKMIKNTTVHSYLEALIQWTIQYLAVTENMLPEWERKQERSWWFKSRWNSHLKDIWLKEPLGHITSFTYFSHSLLPSVNILDLVAY